MTAKAMKTETAQELIHLADWIARRFGLSEMSKIRQEYQADQIHTEIVRRLGEARVSIQPPPSDQATHEANDPAGPWTPIRDCGITKRYVCRRVDGV